jgi:hypothetical protein
MGQIFARPNKVPLLHFASDADLSNPAATNPPLMSDDAAVDSPDRVPPSPPY